MRLYDGIVSGKRFKFVGSSHERKAREVGNVFRHIFRISGRGIDSCTNGRSA